MGCEDEAEGPEQSMDGGDSKDPIPKEIQATPPRQSQAHSRPVVHRGSKLERRLHQVVGVLLRRYTRVSNTVPRPIIYWGEGGLTWMS